MSSNKDWACARCKDAAHAVQANGLSCTLEGIDKPLRFAGASFGTNAISTLMRCVKCHFHLLQPDLDTLQTRDLQFLLLSDPTLFEPVVPEAPQPQQPVDLTVHSNNKLPLVAISADSTIFNATLADPSSPGGP